MIFEVILRILFENKTFLKVLEKYFQYEPEIKRALSFFRKLSNPADAFNQAIKSRVNQALNDSVFKSVKEFAERHHAKIGEFFNKYNPINQLETRLNKLEKAFGQKAHRYLGVPKHPGSEFKRTVRKYGRQSVQEGLSDKEVNWESQKTNDPNKYERRISRINVGIKLDSNALEEGIWVNEMVRRTTKAHRDRDMPGRFHGRVHLKFRNYPKVYIYGNINFATWERMVKARRPHGAGSEYLDSVGIQKTYRRHPITFPVNTPFGKREFLTARYIAQQHRLLARRRANIGRSRTNKKGKPFFTNVETRNKAAKIQGVAKTRRGKLVRTGTFTTAKGYRK